MHTGTSGGLRSRTRRGLGATVSLVALGWCGLCVAETATAPATVEEVVVTSARRAANLQDTPAAISALSSAMIEQRGVSGAQDLQALVPNFNFGTSEGNPTISIRGVGLPIVSGDSQQGVASYLDGVYLTIPSLTDVAIGDLEQVEVLRGPQGTLYGRNATGGAVSYTTKHPSFTWGGGATVGYGDYDTFTSKAYITGPIVDDKVAFRLYGSVRRQGEGYTKNVVTGGYLDRMDSDAVKGDLLIKPANHLTVSLTGLWSRDTGAFFEGVAQGLDGVSTFANGFDFLPYITPPKEGVNYVLGPGQTRLASDESSSRNTRGFIGTIEWKGAGALSLKSVTGYLDHNRASIVPGIAVTPSFNFPFDYVNGWQESDHTFSEEIDATLNVKSLNIIAGLYYAKDNNKAFIPNLIYVTDPTLASILRAPAVFNNQFGTYYQFFSFPLHRASDTTVEAAFVDGTYKFNDRLRAFAGVRVSRDELAGVLTVPPDLSGNPDPCANGAPFSDNRTSASPRAGVQYNVVEGQMTYIQYQRGYKSGGYSQVSCLNKYEPEILDSYEIGYKATLFGKRLTLDVAAFYYDYRNYQVFEITPSLTANILNVPHVNTYGVEISMQARPSANARIDGSLGYLDSRYGDFLQQDAFTYGSTAPVENLKGRQVVQAPSWTGNFGVELTFPVGSKYLDEIRLRTEAYATSKYSLRRFDRPFDFQPGYVSGNLYVIFAMPQEKLSLRVFVRNLGDVRPKLGEIDVVDTGLTQGPYGPPRTVGAELTAKF